MGAPKLAAPLLLSLLATSFSAAAAEPAPLATPATEPGLQTRFSVMAGVTQWTLFRGGNLAVEYKVGRLVFEASHGQGLDLNQIGGFALTSEERDAGVSVKVPWTTGGGVGLRLTEDLHFLIEVKAHRYSVAGSDRNSGVDYTTFSVGPSVFYTFHLTESVFLQPNVRWWPNVATSLPGNEVRLTKSDGGTYLHRAHDFGLFANVNFGYSF